MRDMWASEEYMESERIRQERTNSIEDVDNHIVPKHIAEEIIAMMWTNKPTFGMKEKKI